ncbi:hypothetical protein [Micromonospora sp. NPDC051296]|uniref:hypothetical protein n=1 Tax=Micromonospora sp. NPDC051296 TaxID=3155046 RepID=UPI0034429392
MIASPHLARSWVVRAVIAAVAGVAALCLGVPAGFAGWAAVKTAQAGRGEETPAAAAHAYLLAIFASPDGLGVDRCVCSNRRTDLLQEARDLREQMQVVGSRAKVESTGWTTDDNTGTVSAMVSFRFTDIDPETGRTTFYSGTPHEWRFHTRQERGISGGWKVCRLEAPPLCGNHIRC